MEGESDQRRVITELQIQRQGGTGQRAQERWTAWEGLGCSLNMSVSGDRWNHQGVTASQSSTTCDDWGLDAVC